MQLLLWHDRTPDFSYISYPQPTPTGFIPSEHSDKVSSLWAAVQPSPPFYSNTYVQAAWYLHSNSICPIITSN